jgi:hypothetical protein
VGIKHDFHQTIDKGHGRIEIRRCWTMEQTEFLLGGEKWAKLTSICMNQNFPAASGRGMENVLLANRRFSLQL